MSSLLTLEDYNSVSSQHINEFYELDTAKISLQEFENVLYDFVICNHSISGAEHTFTFEIHNTLWSRLYHVANANDVVFDYFDVDVSFNNGILTVVTTDASIKLRLLLSSYYKQDEIQRTVTIPVNPVVNLDKSQPTLIPPMPIEIYDYYDDEVRQRLINSHIGHNVYRVGDREGYVLINLIKTNLVYDLSETVLNVGSVNHVRLNVDEDYLPGGDLVDEDLLDIIVKYENIEIPVVYDSELEDYCFDIDLTEKVDNKPVKLTINVNEIDIVNSSMNEVSLNCKYQSASSFAELQSQIAEGVEIIELTDNIRFENNLTIPQNTYIIGGGNTVQLSKYNITILSGVNVKINDVDFENGRSCFIQKSNSQLTLTNSKFVNAQITDNYKGSVVSSNNESTITNIDSCTFVNCHHTIYTGGELTVTHSRALFNSWNDHLDTDYSAFLNAFTGDISITNSVFDIDYANKLDTITTEEIQYAQSLIGLSNEVMFNNSNANQFSANDSLPFISSPYNNLSHVFVPFYHEGIEEVVVSSPVLGREDQSVCHRLFDVDWVYKNNTQVTRVEKANTIRKITWEDI